MSYTGSWRKLSYGNGDFFTVVCLPQETGKFPTVLCRTPYTGPEERLSEDENFEKKLAEYSRWLEAGYAMVYQHCRGKGKSSGDFVPYIFEREDGLFLQDWVRRQPFYNGELYLMGGSYTASLHYATAPFAQDIKGAIFEVQDSERYRLWYRNGQMRKGHADWHFRLVEAEAGLRKDFTMGSFSQLPLMGLSERALGIRAEDFEQMLMAPSPDDPFWQTRFGGGETKDAVSCADIPILLTTGYNDFYVGGIFKMWQRMDLKTKEKSALLVSPYNHGDGWHKEHGVVFPNGKRQEAFGENYKIAWLEHIRKGTPIPFAKGVITYYRAFDERWDTDFFAVPTELMKVSLGSGSRSFLYDPAKPPAFRTEGLIAEDTRDLPDVLCLTTAPFEEDTFVKGQMTARLTVSSNRPDTAIFLRISLKKQEFTYTLRHDITSLCYQLGDYQPGSPVVLNFTFDEYAFLIRKGECLQLDIASTDDNVYVCHTNQKGPYALQTEAVKAENTVYLDGSFLTLPVEREEKEKNAL